jgi:hypothetical protein
MYGIREIVNVSGDLVLPNVMEEEVLDTIFLPPIFS